MMIAGTMKMADPSVVPTLIMSASNNDNSRVNAVRSATSEDPEGRVTSLHGSAMLELFLIEDSILLRPVHDKCVNNGMKITILEMRLAHRAHFDEGRKYR